ncbi:hypothetical protein C8J57DRAFT_1477423 [Mycena rebaudengoi]|nr:hypothetical protein C8J57DRAFT_1477423 [Mycena rebaudengoi]
MAGRAKNLALPPGFGCRFSIPSREAANVPLFIVRTAVSILTIVLKRRYFHSNAVAKLEVARLTACQLQAVWFSIVLFHCRTVLPEMQDIWVFATGTRQILVRVSVLGLRREWRARETPRRCRGLHLIFHHSNSKPARLHDGSAARNGSPSQNVDHSEVKCQLICPGRANIHNDVSDSGSNPRSVLNADTVLSPPNGGARPYIAHMNFSNVGRDHIVNYNQNTEPPMMEVLERYVAPEAFYDSAEQPPELGCAPGTRDSILQDLLQWTDPCPKNGTVAWLSGCAGIGKSAIGREFAAHCEHLNYPLATFFFKRGHSRRGKWNHVLPTLAYQLSKHHAAFRASIEESIATDTLLCTRSMMHQYSRLIDKPLRQVEPTSEFCPVIIVDGLDECDDDIEQTRLLNFLLGSIVDGLHFHLLICSRPEQHLASRFQSFEQRHRTLYAGFQVLVDHDAIRQYLEEEFRRLQTEYQGRSVKFKVSEMALDVLVERASGTFIYATTVIRLFSQNKYTLPDQLLQSVLGEVGKLSALDALYTEILNGIVHLQHPPGFLYTLHAAMWGLCPEDIDKVLAPIPAEERTPSRFVLPALSSLLTIPPEKAAFPRGSITILHTSFFDFLTLKERSVEYWINAPEIRNKVYECVFAFLSSPRPLEMTLDPLPDKMLSVLLHELPEFKFELSDPRVQAPTFVQSFSLTSSGHLLCQRLWETEDLKILPPYPAVDDAYRTFLSDPRHAKLLRYLRNMLIWPKDHSGRRQYDGTAHEHINMEWDDLRPLCDVRHHFNVSDTDVEPFTRGASPLDFLADEERARGLYRPTERLQEDAALGMIWYMKRLGQCPHPCPWRVLGDWSTIITNSQSRSVFLELSTLDISPFCANAAADPLGHFIDHVRQPPFRKILRWLEQIRDPEAGPVLQAWRGDMAAAERCYRETTRFVQKADAGKASEPKGTERFWGIAGWRPFILEDYDNGDTPYRPFDCPWEGSDGEDSDEDESMDDVQRENGSRDDAMVDANSEDAVYEDEADGAEQEGQDADLEGDEDMDDVEDDFPEPGMDKQDERVESGSSGLGWFSTMRTGILGDDMFTSRKLDFRRTNLGQPENGPVLEGILVVIVQKDEGEQSPGNNESHRRPGPSTYERMDWMVFTRQKKRWDSLRAAIEIRY